MKNFLIILAAFVLGYILAPFYVVGVTAWIWLPVVFDLNNFFGGCWLGLIIGLVVSIGTQVLVDKLSDN